MQMAMALYPYFTVLDTTGSPVKAPGRDGRSRAIEAHHPGTDASVRREPCA